VVTLPPSNTVEPALSLALSVVSEASAVVPPTAALKVVAPGVLTVSAKAPSSVLANLTPAPPDAVSVVAAPSVTGSL
jgi:hypothetical protein